MYFYIIYIYVCSMYIPGPNCDLSTCYYYIVCVVQSDICCTLYKGGAIYYMSTAVFIAGPWY